MISQINNSIDLNLIIEEEVSALISCLNVHSLGIVTSIGPIVSLTRLVTINHLYVAEQILDKNPQ